MSTAIFRSQDILASHVGTEDLGDLHGTVRLEVVFKESDQHSGRRNNRIVKGVSKIIAILSLYADLQAAGLSVTEI